MPLHGPPSGLSILPKDSALSDPSKDTADTALPEISASAYLIMDGNTGDVLAHHNGHLRRSPASLTKIMTALLVLENGSLDQVLTVPTAITSLRESTLMGLEVGEHITIRDVLYGLLLPSGNDAAIALAAHISGSEAAFVNDMNARAIELGLKNTYFTNSHGLDFEEWDGPYSSAYDLAVMTQEAMKSPTFRAIVGEETYIARSGDLGYYVLRNFNTMLGRYPGATGVKIGETDKAGPSIVATASRGDTRLIAVALDSKQRDTDATLLLDKGFELVQ